MRKSATGRAKSGRRDRRLETSADGPRADGEPAPPLAVWLSEWLGAANINSPEN